MAMVVAVVAVSAAADLAATGLVVAVEVAVSVAADPAPIEVVVEVEAEAFAAILESTGLVVESQVFAVVVSVSMELVAVEVFVDPLLVVPSTVEAVVVLQDAEVLFYPVQFAEEVFVVVVVVENLPIF